MSTNNNLTLNQARALIESNNGRPVSKSTILNWVRQGLLPSTRFGKMYVIAETDADNFVIAEHVRRVGNPGHARPKCEFRDSSLPRQRRCLKTARWVLENAETGTMLVCDEHKEVMSNAETEMAVERLPRQEKKG